MFSILKTFAQRLFQAKGTGMLKPGTPAPDFKVRDHLGREHSLADYRGRRVVLWFYPKADTPG
jgi:thioredoxin-dependent peroxiredoxin